MGELTVYLQERKARLQAQIANAQNYDFTGANQKIAKIDAMLLKLQNNPGWDV